MDVVLKVFEELPIGRVASWPSMCDKMMELVARYDGDHLEIGTLFGGTAIMAALVKKSVSSKGRVVVVDPFDGYYEKGKRDPKTNVEVTRTHFEANVVHFGVGGRIEIVEAKSHPWPEELSSRMFDTAYIDGDHNDEMPYNDWRNVHPRIRKGGLVWFDNCTAQWPGVMEACQRAAFTDGWRKVDYIQNFVFVLEKL